jgi:hypothetical protein
MDNDNRPRGGPRQRTLLRASLSREGCPGAFEIRVRNLSSGGLMANCPEAFARGEAVSVSLRELGDVSGVVVWSGADGIGIAFDRPIDPALAFQPAKPKAPERFIPEIVRERRPGLRIR